MVTGGLIAAVACLLASAVLTAAHDAVFLIGRPYIRTLQGEGFSGADALAEVRERRRTVQTAVRVVTTALDLSALAVMILSSPLNAQFGLLGTAVASILVVLVVADLVPHIVAVRKPVRLALTAAPLLLTFERLTRPLTLPVTKLEDRLGAGDDERDSERRDLREIQAIGEEEGVLEASENLLVERAFRLDELTAWDVMVPRVDIFAWREEQPLSEIISQLAEVPFSRVPVYRDSVDDVTGIVYVREAYERFARGERDLKLADIAREPFFVPGSLSVLQLLQDFQARRIHLGIVADEFGGTDGLVTLEDILEELVGEIVDETDVEEIEIVHLSASAVECDASVDLRDLSEALSVTFPKVEHRSLNGFILDEMGSVPATGDRFDTDGIAIEIVSASETQVLRARVTRLPDEPADEA